MPYTISAGVFISPFTGVQSVNLSLNPQVQRLFQLGSSTAFDKVILNQSNLSITLYSPGPSFNVSPNVGCESATGGVNVTIVDSCGGGGTSGEFFCSSYSYNKDSQGWGTESLTLITAPNLEGAQLILIRGIAEGQATSSSICGVTFATTDASGYFMEVSAGSPGIGKSGDLTFGEVSSVGGGVGKQYGVDGTASVSIPYTPIFI